MYKRILVPLDGSKRAERILPFVEELAAMHESTVIFLQVIESATVMLNGYENQIIYDKDATERMVKEARGYLNALVGELREKGISARYLVDYGPVVRAILDNSVSENVDLVAMASHGRTGLARVFYGSVAAGIMQQADRPLLLIRSNQ